MKSILKITLVVFAFLAMGLTASAQEISNEEIQSTAEMQAKKIGDQMELSESHINKLEASIVKFHTSIERAESSNTDKKGLSNLKRRAHNSFKKEVKTIVSPERYAYFMKLYQSLN